MGDNNGIISVISRTTHRGQYIYEKEIWWPTGDAWHYFQFSNHVFKTLNQAKKAVDEYLGIGVKHHDK